MEWLTLKAELRDKKGTRQCHHLRKNGFIPAILYGRGAPEQLLMIAKKEIRPVLEKGVHLVNLAHAQRTEQAYIKEMQFDPLGEMLLHIDFTRIAMDETITVDVEINLKGQPKGIIEGGVLEQNLHHLSVQCLPDKIPARIEVDISELELNGLIRVKDVVCPPGVTLATEPEVVVVGVHMKKEEEEVVAAAVEPGAAEPEVITEKKEEAPGEKAEVKEEKKPSKEEKKPPKEEKKGK